MAKFRAEEPTKIAAHASPVLAAEAKLLDLVEDVALLLRLRRGGASGAAGALPSFF